MVTSSAGLKWSSEAALVGARPDADLCAGDLAWVIAGSAAATGSGLFVAPFLSRVPDCR